ncbi:glucose 1-dehydrogenase [Methanocrinis sp.]|uniref:glucose 1-dehydrogenase n=1 Tax=Methanocrinis sp. TaxID=3101522 RepID=UPI003D0D39BE
MERSFMKAAAVRPKEKDSARLIDVDLPDPGDDEVLVKVHSVGLDGTDKEIFDGVYGTPPSGEEILIPGHESLGRVEGIGKDVKSFRPGEMVVATVRRPDGCINCQAGEYDMCLLGDYRERGIKGLHGFLSEYYLEKEDFLIKVPEDLGELAVLLEPMSVAEKAVRMAFRVQERLTWRPEVAMVTGTGSLGLLTAMLLRLRGLEVLSVDRSDDDYKAKIFSELGVLHFNTKRTELHDIPKVVGKQIDLIVEETGSSTVALHSIMIVGTNGVVVLASITGGEKRMEICSDCFNQGLVLGNRAVVGTVNAHRLDFERGISDLLAIEERWPGSLSKLITARYPLEDFKEAFSSMKDNIKVVIDFNGPSRG